MRSTMSEQPPVDQVRIGTCSLQAAENCQHLGVSTFYNLPNRISSSRIDARSLLQSSWFNLFPDFQIPAHS